MTDPAESQEELVQRLSTAVMEARKVMNLQELPVEVAEYRDPVSILEEDGVRYGYIRWLICLAPGSRNGDLMVLPTLRLLADGDNLSDELPNWGGASFDNLEEL